MKYNFSTLTTALLIYLMSSQLSASPITYNFTGALNDAFGSLTIGTTFSGYFTYEGIQSDQNPANPNRGDYSYDDLSITISGATVNDAGTGAINVYDSSSYPTDLFHLYTFNVSGVIGGETLAPGGLELVLQDVSGTAFTDISLMGGGLSLSDFTTGNATFVQFRNLDGSQFSRGELTSLSVRTVPIPASIWLFGAGLIVLFGMKGCIHNQVAIHA